MKDMAPNNEDDDDDDDDDDNNNNCDNVYGAVIL